MNDSTALSRQEPFIAPRLLISRSTHVGGSARVPGSKSYTNRALVMAGLARGRSRISNVLAGDDAESMLAGLQAFGAQVVDDTKPGDARSVTITGNGGFFPGGPIVVDADLAGTTLRFLTAVAVIGQGGITITGKPPLLRRPVGPLLAALSACGAEIRGSGELADRAPVTVGRRRGRLGGWVSVDSSQSSQFVTSLLLVAPYFDDDLVVEGTGIAARGFVDLTVEVMRARGAEVTTDSGRFRVTAEKAYEPLDDYVPPDASAASHLFTLAVATGGSITVADLARSVGQPDIAVLEIFERLGGSVIRHPDGSVTVAAGDLGPVDVDLSAMPDQLPNVAVLAALAPGISRIEGVGVTKFHETDRMAAVAQELAKVGVEVELGPEVVVVHGGGARGGATFSTYHDHRMAMALAALAGALGDCYIEGADCVSKTYSDFWSDAGALGLEWSPAEATRD